MDFPNNGIPIELSPDKFLTFKAKRGQIGSVFLTIKNREHRDVYFKVKSNASHFYSVRPGFGVVKPLGCVKVMIKSNDNSLDKLDEIVAKKHKFLILSAVPSDNSEEAEKFWKNKKQGSEGVFEAKLKTKVNKSVSTTVTEEDGKVEMVRPVIIDEWDQSVQYVLVEDKGNDKRATDVHKESMSAPEKKLSALELVPGKEHLDAMLTGPGRGMSGKKLDLVPPFLEENVPGGKLEVVPPIMENFVTGAKLEEVPSVLENSVPEARLDVMSPFPGKSVPFSKTTESSVLSSVTPINGFYAQYTAEMVASLLDKMSAKEALQFRKEMNNLLGKFEEKLIDE